MEKRKTFRLTGFFVCLLLGGLAWILLGNQIVFGLVACFIGISTLAGQAFARKGVARIFSALYSFLPLWFFRWGHYLWRGIIRKRKWKFVFVILFFWALTPVDIFLCQFFYNRGWHSMAVDFVALRVRVLSWWAPVITVNGFNQAENMAAAFLWLAFLNFSLNLASHYVLVIDYSKIIAGILVEHVPGFNTGSYVHARQRGDESVVNTDSFADLRGILDTKHKIENRIGTGVRIVEASNQMPGVFIFRLGVMNIKRLKTGDLVSGVKWNDLQQIDTEKDVNGFWVLCVGDNGRPQYVNLKAFPNFLFCGPPGSGKTTAILHLMSVVARQNPESLFITVDLTKPADYALLEKNWYGVRGKTLEGKDDPSFAQLSYAERVRRAAPLDNFTLFRTEQEFLGLIGWLNEEFDRRNQVLERPENLGMNNTYEVIERDSRRYKNKRETPRLPSIFVNVAEYTIARERYGKSGNPIAEALNRVETAAQEGRNRGIHFLVDSQAATMDAVGLLRRSSHVQLFRVTPAEVEFTFGAKVMPISASGVYTTSGEYGIKSVCGADIGQDDCARHLTDANRVLSKAARLIVLQLRRTVKHEAGEKSQDEMFKGQEAIFEQA
ncbi:MAG: ATP-binding protein [Nitrososphaerales archaeon]